MIEQNIDLVIARAKRFSKADWRDYVASGYIALAEAHLTYIGNGGASFRTYAANMIAYAILDQWRDERKPRRRRAKQLDAFVCAKPVESKPDELLGGCESRLTDRQSTIARMMGAGMRQIEIAEALDVAACTVRRDGWAILAALEREAY